MVSATHPLPLAVKSALVGPKSKVDEIEYPAEADPVPIKDLQRLRLDLQKRMDKAVSLTKQAVKEKAENALNALLAQTETVQQAGEEMPWRDVTCHVEEDVCGTMNDCSYTVKISVRFDNDDGAEDACRKLEQEFFAALNTALPGVSRMTVLPRGTHFQQYGTADLWEFDVFLNDDHLKTLEKDGLI